MCFGSITVSPSSTMRSRSSFLILFFAQSIAWPSPLDAVWYAKSMSRLYSCPSFTKSISGPFLWPVIIHALSMPQRLRDSRACSMRHFEPQWSSSFGIASVMGFRRVPLPAAGIIPIILSLYLLLGVCLYILLV